MNENDPSCIRFGAKRLTVCCCEPFLQLFTILQCLKGSLFTIYGHYIYNFRSEYRSIH